MNLTCQQADFFTSPADHTFYFRVDPGNGASFTVPVVVAQVGDLNAVNARAHENLVVILEKALEMSRALAPKPESPG